MGLAQYFHRSAPVSHVTTTSKDTALFWPFFVSNAVLSALSITNLGLISSMVAWLLEQKHNVHSFAINWPGLQFDLNVEPKNLWVDQGHESNGVAGYGFFLGIFGMITAWRYRKAARPLRSMLTLVVLQLLCILFTLSALIFVFVVTYQSTGQGIRLPIAANIEGQNYPEYWWTPETWMKAVLDLPLADDGKRQEINNRVTNMVAWRWMLIPLLVVDMVVFGITTLAWLRQRRGTTTRSSSADPIEK